jgi:hypothetical protein
VPANRPPALAQRLLDWRLLERTTLSLSQRKSLTDLPSIAEDTLPHLIEEAR